MTYAITGGILLAFAVIGIDWLVNLFLEKDHKEGFRWDAFFIGGIIGWNVCFGLAWAIKGYHEEGPIAGWASAAAAFGFLFLYFFPMYILQLWHSHSLQKSVDRAHDGWEEALAGWKNTNEKLRVNDQSWIDAWQEAINSISENNNAKP